jgi:N-methylhydantoinase A/oxoprolinase/acetone carboxylase beta subunit
MLHTDLLIPNHADVANAVGAVAASVVQRRKISIRPLETTGDDLYRAFLPDGVRDFVHLEEAVAGVRAVMEPFMIARAQEAGAEHVEVKFSREDVIAPLEGGWKREVWLETVLSFIAMGRPALVRA